MYCFFATYTNLALLHFSLRNPENLRNFAAVFYYTTENDYVYTLSGSPCGRILALRHFRGARVWY